MHNRLLCYLFQCKRPKEARRKSECFVSCNPSNLLKSLPNPRPNNAHLIKLNETQFEQVEQEIRVVVNRISIQKKTHSQQQVYHLGESHKPPKIIIHNNGYRISDYNSGSPFLLYKKEKTKLKTSNPF